MGKTKKSVDKSLQLYCRSCGLTWTRRQFNPVACPRCGSKSWNSRHKRGKVAAWQRKHLAAWPAIVASGEPNL